MVIENIVKGDSINLDIKLNTNLSDWKIRAELTDGCCEGIEVSSSNDGGSEEEIERIDDSIGHFIVHIAKDLTTNFDDEGFFEVEIEDINGKVYTPIIGKKTRVLFVPQIIT